MNDFELFILALAGKYLLLGFLFIGLVAGAYIMITPMKWDRP